MSIIKFEWGRDFRGNDVLVARKSHGKFSISELQETMKKDSRFQGIWVIVFKTYEDTYQCWNNGIDPKGDILELYQIGDGESCPICATAFSGIEYCPNCGERLKE